MRYLLKVEMPHETFNSLVRKGTAGERLQKIIDELGAEAVYFTEFNGKRAMIAVVDIAEPSRVPSIAEPFFLSFNADVELRVAMTPAELEQADLAALGSKWG